MHKSSFGYTGTFTDFLFGYLNQDCISNENFAEFCCPYCMAPEDISAEEKDDIAKKYNNGHEMQIVVFRVPGYTVGHLIVDKTNGIIQDVFVYSRPTHADNFFKLSCEELNEKVKIFKGKKLDLVWEAPEENNV